jgi:asparagine synthase (glutamine-hydrolysing)
VRAGPLGRGVGACAPILDWTARSLSRLNRPQLDLAARKLEWLSAIDDPARHYLLLRNGWDFNRQLVERVYTPEFVGRLSIALRDEYDPYFDDDESVEGQVLRTEFMTKMVSDLLHNEDTMSMAHSVESRVPLLDLELVRYAARIPDEMRFGSGMKGLLKEALRPVLPDQVLEKKKWGFTFDPVEQFAKDLGPMARELLTPERLRRSGVFNPEFVRAVLAAKPHQRLRWHYFMLWQMIGLELWSDIFVGGRLAASQQTGPRSPAPAEGV